MKCPCCNGTGRTPMVTIVKTDSGLPCDFPCIECDGTGEVEMTNEYFLQTATTEELAEVLNKIFMTRTFCHICPEGGVCDIGYECKYHGGNTKDFVEWLKQPHTDKE